LSTKAYSPQVMPSGERFYFHPELFLLNSLLT
jgi:hypothetical protein